MRRVARARNSRNKVGGADDHRVATGRAFAAVRVHGVVHFEQPVYYSSIMSFANAGGSSTACRNASRDAAVLHLSDTLKFRTNNLVRNDTENIVLVAGEPLSDAARETMIGWTNRPAVGDMDAIRTRFYSEKRAQEQEVRKNNKNKKQKRKRDALAAEAFEKASAKAED